MTFQYMATQKRRQLLASEYAIFQVSNYVVVLGRFPGFHQANTEETSVP